MIVNISLSLLLRDFCYRYIYLAAHSCRYTGIAGGVFKQVYSPKEEVTISAKMQQLLLLLLLLLLMRVVVDVNVVSGCLLKKEREIVL